MTNFLLRLAIAGGSVAIILLDLIGIFHFFDALIHAGSNVGGIIGNAIALIVLIIILIPVGFIGVFGSIIAVIAD